MHQNPASNIESHFDIHASVVFRLGDELISDEIQALVELIKNSYDADATYARVRVATRASLDFESAYPDANGYIIIEDDGAGMTEATIQYGWLVISNSSKAQMKADAETTEKFGRTPQGDKGLGRLGTQRLGYNLEIFTKPEKEDFEYHVSFDWRDFLSSNPLLTKVPVKFTKRPSTRKAGTRLIISDLRNLELWRGKDAESRLQSSLARLISPFKKIRHFFVDLRIDGKNFNFAEIADELRKTAQLHYEIEFRNGQFIVKGFAKLAYISPLETDRDSFKELVTADDGQGLLQFLMNRKKGVGFHLKPNSTTNSGWAEYQYSKSLEDLDGVSLVDGLPANPGNFSGEIDYFHFEEGAKGQNIFEKSEYKDYIRTLSGIGIYRDGFGIRVDSDWLNLRSEATSGRSRYVLRPDNTIGYIEISSLGNPQLKETTSREGFIANSYFQNFYKLLHGFVKFSGDVQNFLRRGWIEFRDEMRGQRIKPIVKDMSPKGLSQDIQKSLEQADSRRERLIQTVEKLSQTLNLENEAAAFQSGQVTLEQTIKENLPELQDQVKYLSELSAKATVPEVLMSQFKQLQEQLSQTYETMSLGLTAEILSHEINNITQQLGERTEQLAQYLKGKKDIDGRILSYIEYVRTSISGLRKQLSHFTPALKYVREKRENINLKRYIPDLIDFYHERMLEKHISVEIEQVDRLDFVISMNKGKLTQVLDNLVLNSEYWLQEDIRLNRISSGIITITLDKPLVYISDSGRGIHPSIEAALFEPFVSTKENNQGRGLGLFITHQLLDTEGCTIRLSSDRNKHDRLFKFELNLSNRIVTND